MISMNVKNLGVEYFNWEGEPPGDPLFVNSVEEAVFSVNNLKHQNAAHQEVRPPNFGFRPNDIVIARPR